jgi:hypothetical protein
MTGTDLNFISRQLESREPFTSQLCPLYCTLWRHISIGQDFRKWKCGSVFSPTTQMLHKHLTDQQISLRTFPNSEYRKDATRKS